MNHIKNIIEIAFILITLGILLHWYAFAIAWGVAKGWAKVTHVIQQNYNIKKD